MASLSQQDASFSKMSQKFQDTPIGRKQATSSSSSSLSKSTSDFDMDTAKSLRARITDMVRQSLLSSSILMGDELNLFKGMRGLVNGITDQELANKCKVDLRHIQEWLLSMVAFKIIIQNDHHYILPEEHAIVLIDEETPLSGIGMLQYGVGAVMSHEALVSGFKSGTGIDVCEMDPRCSHGIRRWYRTVYEALLIKEWIPKLDPVHLLKLENGALVADVGCGHGIPTILLAKRFPKSKFIGYDYDRDSIDAAKLAAQEAKLDNIEFKLASGPYFGTELGKTNVFDAIFFMVAFHDFSNPEQTATHCCDILKPDGFVLAVEPYAGHTVSETLNHPFGALFTLISQHYCMPVGKSNADKGSRVLGAVCLTPEYNKIWVNEAKFYECNVLPVQNTPNHRVFQINKQSNH